MSTEQEVAVQFMQAHPEFLPCDLNSRLIQSYLDSVNPPLPFTAENLERAYADLGDQLAKKPQPKSKPVVKTLDEEAPIPSYFPELETLADIRRISREDAHKLATGPDRAKYQARLTAIERGFRNPKSTTPQVTQQPEIDQYGLPAVPAGADPEFWPNTKADIDKMGKNYGLLLRSKKYGKAFEARVNAILERERQGGR